MEKKIAITGLRLTEDVKERIRKQAEKKSLTLSQWIREAIIQRLQRAESTNA